MMSTKKKALRGVLLGVVLQAAASAQVRPDAAVLNLCDVFSSPDGYNHKVVTVEGVLSPSIHTVFLSALACKATADADFTTQAVLPEAWVTSPHGKELRKFLHRGKSATVKITGTFEADPHRYGPDGARFRFTITGISSVEAAPPDFHL